MSEPTGTQYGGFWVRLIALLADSAIVFLFSALVIGGAAMALGPEALMPVMLAVWIAGALYWPVMHASRRQATFGKAIVGLKVTRFDGRRITILRSLWREIVAKTFSAAVVMLGYIMAAFTPRKQALHDLMSATYVVREGASRVVPALAVAVAGFALPVVVGPMILGAAVVSSMTSMAQGLVSEQQPMKPAPRPISTVQKAAPKPAPAAPAPAEPAVVAKAPEQPAPPPPAPAAAPTPAPVATPTPAPLAAPEVKSAPEAKPEAATAKSKSRQASTKPKLRVAAAKTKPDDSGLKVTARPSQPAAQPDELKRMTGLRHNDLMSAVLDGDVESVNALLKLGKWPDKPDSQGLTPLMVAAGRGDLRTAEALLRAGADGRSAAPLAQKRGDGEMMALLARYRR
jgi:uncharacterized RDD family membrane protein YckC